jgi:hypothetical protein
LTTLDTDAREVQPLAEQLQERIGERPYKSRISLEGTSHASVVVASLLDAVASIAARRLVASGVHHTDLSIPARRRVRAAHPPERDASLRARGGALVITA